VTAALQNGDYPDGLASLKDFLSRLKRGGKDAAAIALVEYRYINAEFGAKLADSNADVADAQVQWLAQLRDFTEKYPTDENVPDAMMQLAMSDEFEGKREAAEKWYQSIATKFSKSQYAGKARGAIRRLDSVGKPMQLRGRTLGGETVDIADLGGNVVLIHYWADWCDICKREFTQLEQIRNAHPRLKLIGINCDNDLQAARQAAEKAGLRWPQLHSTGGYNSGLAAEMGIVSLPSMILVDQAGKILSTTVTASTLERELNSISK
jgi:thiol-disulfide isomerase/thioredoxin